MSHHHMTLHHYMTSHYHITSDVVIWCHPTISHTMSHNRMMSHPLMTSHQHGVTPLWGCSVMRSNHQILPWLHTITAPHIQDVVTSWHHIIIASQCHSVTQTKHPAVTASSKNLRFNHFTLFCQCQVTNSNAQMFNPSKYISSVLSRVYIDEV